MGRRNSERFRTGRVNIEKVRDKLGKHWLGEARGGPKGVGGSLQRSGTGWETLGEIRKGSGDPRVSSGRVERPSRSYGMVWGSIGEVRDGS